MIMMMMRRRNKGEKKKNTRKINSGTGRGERGGREEKKELGNTLSNFVGL
jgi:hypothetical protein